MQRSLALSPLGLAALVALAGAVGSAGCAEQRVQGPPPSESTARSGPLGPQAPPMPFPALAGSAPADPGPTLLPAGPEGVPLGAPAALPRAWIEAVRLERWAEAAAQIDALPDADRARPEMRYVRARAAVGSGDGGKAVSLLAGLEPQLPLLADDIPRWRAEAELAAGPYADAAAYFAKSARPRDLAKAAVAYDKAGDTASALRSADLAVAAAARGKSAREEASARMVRARLRQSKTGDAAAEPDYRWVATHVPGSADGRAAADALEKMKRPLSPKEKLQSVDGLVDSGSPEAAAEIERMGKAPELLHARAMALYKARDYPEAAKAFQAAAKAPGKNGQEAEDWFYAARSMARADRDEDAIKAYLSVATRYKKSSYAEKAQYLAARLYLQGGRFKEAAKAYTAYLSAYKKGSSREDAEYERSLAWLSSGDPKAARKSLADQARRAGGEDSAKLHELEGVAAFRAGDPAAAIALWTEIARAIPLSWAAQTSRARLVGAGAPVPPLIEPAQERGAGKLEMKLPPAPSLLASIGLDGDAEARLAAAEREISAPYAGREGEALCGVYGLLSRAKRRYRVGINAVGLASLMRAPSESERWTWECLYPQPFAAGVRPLEDQHGLPKGLLHALMRQESAFDPAIVSPASAVGLMQLMPSTAKQAASEIAVDFDPDRLTSPDFNLKIGAFYIAKLLKMFQGQVALAAAAYNAGPKAVSHWLEAGVDNELDLWVARIPFDETRIYVARVAQNLARYQWLQGGEGAVAPLSLVIPAGAKAPPDAY
jgi:soluble lytic murein transglycosylase